MIQPARRQGHAISSAILRKRPNERCPKHVRKMRGMGAQVLRPPSIASLDRTSDCQRSVQSKGNESQGTARLTRVLLRKSIASTGA